MVGSEKTSYSQVYKRRKAIKRHLTWIWLILFLIIAIPLCILVLQKQTQHVDTSRPSTSILVSSPTTSVAAGSTISVDVIVVPNKTTISLVKLVLSYNKTILRVADPFAINTLAFPTTLINPDYTTCHGNTCYISLTVSTGANTANALSAKTTIGRIVFTALQPTATTTVAVDTTSEVSSLQYGIQPPTETTPLAFTIKDASRPEPKQPANCMYQTVCFSCPAGQLCLNFSCTKQLVCVSPANTAPKPTAKPTLVISP